MALIAKKDVELLLNAGFSEEELGLVDGGIQGVEVYETPEDYFAKELIENACEEGTCSIWDDIPVADDFKKEPYDTSHKPLYHDQEYAGNDDPYEDVPQALRPQVEFISKLKLGRLSVWQRKNKQGIYEWPVRNLKVEIPEDDQERYNRLPKDIQKELWIAYAKDEWKRLWKYAVESLRCYHYEEIIKIKTKKGSTLNVLVIPADNLRNIGYDNLPSEARWLTMVYFEKDDRD